MTGEVEMGTVSHGTMRSADLIPAFDSELRRIAPGRARKVHSEYRDLFRSFGQTARHLGGYNPYQDAIEAVEMRSDAEMESVGYLVEALFDALNDEAPEGCYFGAHPGDGSDYGFWACEEF